ncbi:ribonuclease M5 [Lacticaseibacillus sp. GG6-2]
MSKFKQIIVVEGRDDTKRLTEAFGPIDTIETRGSAISKETLALIAHAQATRGVIVLTDPDFPGEKIRKTISAAVPGVTHAFLPRADARPDRAHQSLGVEHATPAALKEALAHLIVETPDAQAQIATSTLYAAGLIGGPRAAKRRARIGDVLHIGYTNGKQLQKRLRQFGITEAQLQQAVAQLDEEDAHA